MDNEIKVRAPAGAFLSDLMLRVPQWKEDACLSMSLDLGEVRFLDSMEIGQLVRLHIACRDLGIRLVASNLQPDVRRSVIHAGVAGLLGVMLAPMPFFDPNQTQPEG
ncbi:STAS domain-containing protein [Candidatus Poribacteria bacterium]|nr:STAS domain-containing protein [Candidatus Poribacteria bacterium]